MTQWITVIIGVIVAVILIYVLFTSLKIAYNYIKNLFKQGEEILSSENLGNFGACTPQTKMEQAVVCAFELGEGNRNSEYCKELTTYDKCVYLPKVKEGQEFSLEMKNIQWDQKSQRPTVVVDDNSSFSDYSSANCGMVIDEEGNVLCSVITLVKVPSNLEVSQTYKNFEVGGCALRNCELKNALTDVMLKAPSDGRWTVCAKEEGEVSIKFEPSSSRGQVA